MNIPFFTFALKRLTQKRIRSIMLGYRFLKKSNQLGLVAAVKYELTNTHISIIDRNASRLFFALVLKSGANCSLISIH